MKRTTSQSPKGTRTKGKASRGRKAAETTKTAKARSAPKAGAASAKRSARKAPAKRSARTTAPRRSATRATTEASSSPSSRLVGDREHVYELLQSFSTVMLATIESESQRLRVRPMNVAALAPDCAVTFLTAIDTAKVEEAQQALTYVIAQSKRAFVSLNGRCEVVHDRARIRSAWRPVDRIYFPDGPETGNLCLLVFHPEEAELWDISGTKGLRFLFEAARALVTGTTPDHDPQQHDRIDLSGA